MCVFIGLTSGNEKERKKKISLVFGGFQRRSGSSFYFSFVEDFMFLVSLMLISVSVLFFVRQGT